MGAWIEMGRTQSQNLANIVAPFVGAWIEIAQLKCTIVVLFVAPFVGAWIEILYVYTKERDK